LSAELIQPQNDMPKRNASPRPPTKGSRDKAKAQGKPKTGNDFGEEGTNKTIPVPRPDGAEPEELGNTPHIEKSPYTRG
jgi:hypothetical protein